METEYEISDRNQYRYWSVMNGLMDAYNWKDESGSTVWTTFGAKGEDPKLRQRDEVVETLNLLHISSSVRPEIVSHELACDKYAHYAVRAAELSGQQAVRSLISSSESS
jgi:hypothetical protein